MKKAKCLLYFLGTMLGVSTSQYKTQISNIIKMINLINLFFGTFFLYNI